MALLRPRVDEADEVEAVLGVAQELARDALADVARADDDRVLQVERVPAADRARDRAGEHDEEDREDPEADRLPEARVGEAGDAQHDERHPGPDRDDVEDADDVVGGRVVRRSSSWS